MRCRGKEILTGGLRNVGSTRQADQQGGEGVFISGGQAAVRAWVEHAGSLALPPTAFRSVCSCYGADLLLGFYRKSCMLGNCQLWVEVTMATIPALLATKETVAMTMATRYRRQVIGYQFHLEADSSSPLLPSVTNC